MVSDGVATVKEPSYCCIMKNYAKETSHPIATKDLNTNKGNMHRFEKAEVEGRVNGNKRKVHRKKRMQQVRSIHSGELIIQQSRKIESENKQLTGEGDMRTEDTIVVVYDTFVPAVGHLPHILGFGNGGRLGSVRRRIWPQCRNPLPKKFGCTG